MKQIVIALASLALCACGFTPLYANGSGGTIGVEQIDGRSGHSLRKTLIQQLSVGIPGIDGPASLSVKLIEDVDRLALQPDESAARTDVNVRANYVLSFEGGALSGTAEAQTSFQVPDAPFADVPAQVDAADRAMTVLARRLVDDIRIKAAKLE